jgi:hypothetical protein
MNRSIHGMVFAVLTAVGAGCASGAILFEPVRETRRSHLGIAVEAPGTQHWIVGEKRYEGGWRIMYKYENAAEPASTRLLFLKADRYDPGGFARAHGTLRDLADKVLQETRQGSDPRRFKEMSAEVVRSDLAGVEAYRVRIAWEERDNPRLPAMKLLLQNVQFLILHPRNPDEIVSITSSTRHQIGKEALSPDELATSFLGSLRFE